MAPQFSHGSHNWPVILVLTLSPELRERAVRMLQEHRDEYASEPAAINSIAPMIGCHPDTLRIWLRQHERDSTGASGNGDSELTLSERQRLKELERM